MLYNTYITIWENNPLAQIQNMISNSILNNNTIIIIAFASFNFVSPDYIPGFTNISIDDVIEINNLIHSNGAKVCLSLGGQTNPFYNSNFYYNPDELANIINIILNKCNFDGIDFNIEDYYVNVPIDFSIQVASLINSLKKINNKLYITLTTHGQAWNASSYQQHLLNLTIENINAWQPMEYNLWIEDGSSYFSQIQYDILFYINSWNIDSNKIILGLMPGFDEHNNNLSLLDTANLKSFALDFNLQGIMIWNANIERLGINGQSPYAYSKEIQNKFKILKN